MFLFYGNGTIFPFEDRFVLTALIALLLAALLWAWSGGGKAGAERVSPAFLLSGLTLLLVAELSISALEPLVPKADLAKRSAYRERLEHRDVVAFLRAQPLGSRSDLRQEDVGGALADIHQVAVFQGSSASIPEALWDLRIATPGNRQLYGVSHYIGTEPPPAAADGVSPGQPVAAFEGGLRAWQVPGALPRAWVAHRTEAVPDIEQLRARVSAPGRNLTATALFVGEAPALAACEESSGDDSAEIVEYGMNFVALAVRSSCAGVVVLSDTAFPGWKATVDGVPREIHPAYHAFRGVVVEAGAHRVEMHYSPASVYWGMGLSVLGWILAALVIARERQGRS
ncbi:MAG: YfhO family protein [Bryobacterales bacterium]|nr:YfhO family protein [Bryobacterales bacterium]